MQKNLYSNFYIMCNPEYYMRTLVLKKKNLNPPPYPPTYQPPLINSTAPWKSKPLQIIALNIDGLKGGTRENQYV